MKFLVLFFAFAFSINQAYASNWGLSIGSASFDSDVAEEEGIEDSSTLLAFVYEGNKADDQFYAIGLNIYLLDDNDSFSNNTTGGVKSSSASAGGLYGEYGIKYNLGEKSVFSASAGYEAVLSASRSISNCIGCDSESIDLDGGPFIRAGIRFLVDDSYSLGVNYSKFLSSDDGLESAIAFTVIFGDY